MDLQTRKILFVKEFLKLESEKAINLFEKLLKKESTISSDFKPMTIQELQNRIDQSNNDSEKGKLIASSDLISEIERWS